MNISFAFVKHNRFYNSSNLITVPWTNKELNITYASYRDKTLPGSEEKWKIKLAGYENEKVAAEILASMYDASLDQFKPQQWTIPSIWPTAFFRSFSGGNNFLSVRSVEKSSYTPIAQFLKMYDYLQTNQIINVRQRRSMGFYAPKIVREDSLAGANATYKDGEANQSRDLQEVVVRGVSAISGSPLIVVDGVIYEGALNAINPTHIESINIVKGAEATALYGTRGANGVILVKTK